MTTRARTAQIQRMATGIMVALAMALLLHVGPVLAKTINCALGDACVGTNRADTITAQGRNFIDGKGGNDTILFRGGRSVILGGTGDDKIIDEFGDNIIVTGNDDDTIRSKGGASDIDGGDGDDKIIEEFGASDIKGGGDRDTIEARNGRFDIIDCGPGRDTVTYDEGLDSVTNCENQRP